MTKARKSSQSRTKIANEIISLSTGRVPYTFWPSRMRDVWYMLLKKNHLSPKGGAPEVPAWRARKEVRSRVTLFINDSRHQTRAIYYITEKKETNIIFQ